VEQYLKMLPLVRQSPGQQVSMSYDAEADVLYVNFNSPNVADDSELTDDDIIIRYAGDDIIGYTVLNASKRAPLKF
jgi:uncharacterized protein YuzE